jgi:DNA-binding Lrp family transcriptional regulator
MLTRWVAAIAAADVGPSCKMLLFYLVASGRCTTSGAISFPRDAVAHELGLHPQRISERIREARDAGLLDKRGGGYRGRAAEYVAVIPGKVTAERSPLALNGYGSAVTISGHLSDGHRPGKVTAERSANTRALVSATEMRTDAKTHSGNCAVCGSPSGSAELCIECYALAVTRQRQESA